MFIERVSYLKRHREEKSWDELRLKNASVLDRYSAPLVVSKGEYPGRVWYFRDITDRKPAKARSEFLSFHDALNGLPHRPLLQDRLNAALAGARQRHKKRALLFVDFARFKSIHASLKLNTPSSRSRLNRIILVWYMPRRSGYLSYGIRRDATGALMALEASTARVTILDWTYCRTPGFDHDLHFAKLVQQAIQSR